MTWVIDPAHTFIEFTAKHMMFTTVRGRFHTFHDTVKLDEANPLLSSAEGVVETNSLDTQEPFRDSHLGSPDFFDVTRFPTIIFRTSRIEPMGQNVYNVAGLLTIKDVTREIVFEVVSLNLGKEFVITDSRLCLATSEDDIDQTIEAASRAFRQVA